ncbi:MAG: hypothetical protein OXN94_08480 [Chloroflexota bacterium]|nr:hypothetical protein [Chloroflexota bacterium]MDE2951511.1 hypothetical protein [Chloroflexota bacterium]
MPVVNGLQETFSDRIEFVLLDLDDARQDGIRRQLGITAQAQYILVGADGAIVQKWFGVLDQARVSAELEALLQT